jgi:uncharacterized protein
LLDFKPELLIELKTYRMPYGKYKGVLVSNIPVDYLEWTASKGWPAGKLGMLLSTMHVIKTNGLEDLFAQL